MGPLGLWKMLLLGENLTVQASSLKRANVTETRVMLAHSLTVDICRTIMDRLCVYSQTDPPAARRSTACRMWCILHLAHRHARRARQSNRLVGEPERGPSRLPPSCTKGWRRRRGGCLVHTPVSHHAPTGPANTATRAQISWREVACSTCQLGGALVTEGGMVRVCVGDCRGAYVWWRWS